MPSPATIDLDALLAPLPGDPAVGPDLRADDSPTSPYFQLRTRRQECRDAERQADAGAGDGKLPAWDAVLAGCEKILRESSKDFEIACWLIEAQARCNGFAGLRDGFRLAKGLAAAFWDSLNSVRDDADPTARFEPLAVLNGKGREGALIAPIRKIALTPSVPPGPFAYWQCEQQERQNSLGEVEQAARQAGRAFYVALLEDIGAAQAAYDELTSFMQERLGSGAPPSTAIRDALTQVAEMTQRISGVQLGATAAASGAAAPATQPGAPAADAGGDIASREQALAVILRAAQFFRVHEPHSPLSYTLEDAVRRARLPLPDLLEELVQDEEARRRMLMNAGIQPPPPKTS